MITTNSRVCVVLVIDDLEYGGAQRQVVELANNMDRERFDVHVCTLSNYVPLGKQLRDSEHRLHTVVKRNKVDFTVVWRLARLLKSLNADIVHSYLFSADIASRLAGHLAGTRLIIGSERSAHYSPRKRNILAYKLTKKCVDLTIANSRTGADFNSKMFANPASDYRIVYNGVDTERFIPQNPIAMKNELGLSEKAQVIGIFASFNPAKNHSMLFRAFKIVLNSFPGTQLLLVGDQLYGNMNGTGEYHNKMKNLIDELGVRHQCIFIGNRDDVERIYPACDITALPSLKEGMSNVLLESMACGVPVVVTNVCDNSHVVKEGQTGYLVEVGDVEGMADRIRMLLENNAIRQEMGLNARKWVLEQFSLEQLAKNTADVYLEALNRKHGTD